MLTPDNPNWGVPPIRWSGADSIDYVDRLRLVCAVLANWLVSRDSGDPTTESMRLGQIALRDNAGWFRPIKNWSKLFVSPSALQVVLTEQSRQWGEVALWCQGQFKFVVVERYRRQPLRASIRHSATSLKVCYRVSSLPYSCGEIEWQFPC